MCSERKMTFYAKEKLKIGLTFLKKKKESRKDRPLKNANGELRRTTAVGVVDSSGNGQDSLARAR